MKCIGILGGMAPESTLSYYAHITRLYYETRRDYHYPEIVIFSATFDPYIRCEYECPNEVRGAIERLAAAGADFVVAACNSIHIVYEHVAPTAKIPWISIMDVTADDILAKGMRRVGLLGTNFTMTKGFYQRALSRRGIETLVPDAASRENVHRIIYGELCHNVLREESRRCLVGCIADLQAQGAEGVILGCTELPLLVQQEHTPVPVFDTSALHAERALRLALA